MENLLSVAVATRAAFVQMPPVPIAILMMILLLVCQASAAEPTIPAVPKVLIVYENDSTQASAVELAAGFREGLAAKLETIPEIYSEHLDSQRFSSAERLSYLASDLAEKYRGVRFDVAIAMGPTALDFMTANRNSLAVGAPLIFGAVMDPLPDLAQSSQDMGGVISQFDVGRTIKLARRLQPGADRIVVFTGSAPFDKDWQRTARDVLSVEQSDIAVDYVSDLSLDDFKTMAASLTTADILLILTIIEDAEGRRQIPRDAAGQIATVSGAPAYGVYSTFIGGGVLGGDINTFQSIGREAATLAVEAFQTKERPRIVRLSGQPVIDWRQLQRFGIPVERLPENTLLRFYQPTAWEQYRSQILTLIAVIILQGATISVLVAQDWRRRRVEKELGQRRAELAHLSRASQLGELSGAFAHELNQPLTAILANAETGISMLRSDSPDIEELSDIFRDIVEDDKRAAGVIAQLRRLMLKGSAELVPMDLNQAVAATIALVHSELVTRDTQVTFRPERPVLQVAGNFEQIQQIILNLILNSCEAMAYLAPAERRIAINTRTRHDGVHELTVSDRGQGLSPVMKERAFEPFVSSKANGLGLGLAICGTIAKAHGGSLKFDEQREYGAQIILTLPPLRGWNGEHNSDSLSGG